MGSGTGSLRALFASALAGLLGCNALTGVSDLEEVPCTTDCVDATSPEDTSAVDTEPRDTGTDTADASDPDAPPRCKGPKDCDDGDDCTVDRCDLDSGACTSTKVDDDDDTYSPTHLGACGLDCDDTNRDVHPTQTEWFDLPYLPGAGDAAVEASSEASADAAIDAAPPMPSFDYDCNGVAEKENTAQYKCVLAGAKCTVTEGWSTATAPACGALGTWVSACTPSPLGSGCLPAGTSKVRQRCH